MKTDHAEAESRGPSDARLDLSVVIPVYNSAATLPKLIGRLAPILASSGLSYEIVLVDDGSSDDSWAVLKQLKADEPCHLTLIQLMRNFGQHNALMCGFRRARGEVIVTMDDDLQNPPEEVPKLLHALEETGDDVIYGTYAAYREKQAGMLRHLGSALIRWFYRRVFGSEVQTTSFRALRRSVARSIFAYDLNYTYIDGLLAWSTNRISTVVVEHEPRFEGRSGYSVGKLLVLALNLFTNFSLLPLQMVSVVGVLCALGGFAVGAYYFIQYLLSNIAIPGFASTVIAVLVLGGIQLLALGVIGEYLGRLHLNVNRKPQYVEREFDR